MPVARRRELLQVAARHGVLVLEDTAYNELYFGAELWPTLAALAQGHFVITAGTFSKVIAPGLRVGWLQARPELLRLLMPARFDMGNSPLQHRMLHEFMVSGELAAHVARMRALYRSKMRSLASALRATCGAAVQFTEPAGGFFLWLRLAAPLRAQTVQERALRNWRSSTATACASCCPAAPAAEGPIAPSISRWRTSTQQFSVNGG